MDQERWGLPGAAGNAWRQKEPFQPHGVPSKPLNNGPFLPCLGTETGIKGQWECRWQGPGSQRGQEGHAEPGVPNRAPPGLP